MPHILLLLHLITPLLTLLLPFDGNCKLFPAVFRVFHFSNSSNPWCIDWFARPPELCSLHIYTAGPWPGQGGEPWDIRPRPHHPWHQTGARIAFQTGIHARRCKSLSLLLTFKLSNAMVLRNSTQIRCNENNFQFPHFSASFLATLPCPHAPAGG